MAGRIKYITPHYNEAQPKALAHYKADPQIAERLGVSPAMWQRYLSGTSPIPLNLVYERACDDPFVASFLQSFLKGLAGG